MNADESTCSELDLSSEDLTDSDEPVQYCSSCGKLLGQGAATPYLLLSEVLHIFELMHKSGRLDPVHQPLTALIITKIYRAGVEPFSLPRLVEDSGPGSLPERKSNV